MGLAMREFSGDEKKLVREIIEKLASLDEKAIISYWVSSGIEEAELYNRLASLAEEYSWDRRIYTLFKRLAGESLEHAEILLREYQRRYPGESLVEVKVPGIEVGLGLSELEKTLMEGNLSDLISILVESEKLARDVYLHLAKASKGKTSRLFDNLARIEESHYKKLLELKRSLAEERSGL